MSRERYLIIPAGGSGTRMGSSTPKQFLELEGKPVMLRTLEAFDEAFDDIHIVLALPSRHFETWKALCRKHLFDHPFRVVSGGPTRFHSVKNALETVPDGALVAVHDAVRPFVGKEFLQRLFYLAESVPAVVPVEPITQTVRCLQKTDNPLAQDGALLGEDSALDTLPAEDISRSSDKEQFWEAIPSMSADRSVLFTVQTPQIFHSEILSKAYTLPFRESFTDDASVVEALGEKVLYVKGEPFNIKITTPQDMVLGRLILGSQSSGFESGGQQSGNR